MCVRGEFSIVLAGNSSTTTVHGAVTSSLADQHFMLFLQLVAAKVTNLPLGFRTGLGLGLWLWYFTSLSVSCVAAQLGCSVLLLGSASQLGYMCMVCVCISLRRLYTVEPDCSRSSVGELLDIMMNFELCRCVDNFAHSDYRR